LKNLFHRTAKGLVFVVALALAGVAAEAKGLSIASLDAWLKAYGAAWVERDASAAGPLFTPDANYHEMPFDPPKAGREAIEKYWREVTADQRDVKFKYEIIAVHGNTGVAHWSAKFRLESNGATIELDGMFVLEFDSSGHCTTLREWWHVKGAN
jgi:ketosteroid isomerase-like protein